VVAALPERLLDQAGVLGGEHLALDARMEDAHVASIVTGAAYNRWTSDCCTGNIAAMERQTATVEGTPTFVSMDEAAHLLGVSSRTIRRRVSDGSLPAYRVGDAPNSRIRIDVAELLAWLEGE
jgi:excisionase family DNA binding protein